MTDKETKMTAMDTVLNDLEKMGATVVRRGDDSAVAVDGAMVGPIPDEQVSSYLTDFDHLMFPKKWGGSGTGTLEEAASTDPKQFSTEMQDLALAIWQIRAEHVDDYEAAVQALVELLRENELYLEMVDADGYFLVEKAKHRH